MKKLIFGISSSVILFSYVHANEKQSARDTALLRLNRVTQHMRPELVNDHIAKEILSLLPGQIIPNDINDSTNVTGDRLAHIAAQKGDIERLHTLSRLGANLQQYNNSGRAPIHIAAYEAQESAINYLKDHGASLNDLCLDGTSVLHAMLAGKKFNAELFKRSITEVNANAINKIDGKTPLVLAADVNNRTALQLLLESKLVKNIDHQDAIGNGALHYACAPTLGMNASWMALQLLVAGAQRNLLNEKKQSPLYFAALDPLSDDIHPKYLVVQKLLQLGANPDAKDEQGSTPLHNAAISGNELTVAQLLELGVEVAPREAGGVTPLHLACAQGNVAIARMLLNAGASKDARTVHGHTPLHFAALQTMKPEMVKFLVQEIGADVHARDDKGKKPSQLGHSDAVIAFLEQCESKTPEKALAKL